MKFDPILDQTMRGDAQHHAERIAAAVGENYGYKMSNGSRQRLAAVILQEMRYAHEDAQVTQISRASTTR